MTVIDKANSMPLVDGHKIVEVRCDQIKKCMVMNAESKDGVRFTAVMSDKEVYVNLPDSEKFAAMVNDRLRNGYLTELNNRGMRNPS